MPSFAEHMERAAKKHPEVFSALLEYERTKKIPKFSYRKRIDLTINENILREFKDHCQKRNLNMSRVIENCMKNELER